MVHCVVISRTPRNTFLVVWLEGEPLPYFKEFDLEADACEQARRVMSGEYFEKREYCEGHSRG